MKPKERPAGRGDIADGSTDPTTERILDAFERLMQRGMDQHASDINEIDITMAQAKALFTVVAAHEIRMTDLAGRLGVTSSTATGLVDGLVDLGLASRHEDPRDRRQVVVIATEHAHTVMERFRELNAAQMRHLLGFVEPSRLPIIEQAVELMLEAADAAATARLDLINHDNQGVPS